MECAAAVVVFENASPAVVDALSRLFRIVKSFGLFLSCAKFSIIRQMAVIAFPVDFIFAFLFQMDSKLWLNASKTVVIEISIGRVKVKFPSKMAVFG